MDLSFTLALTGAAAIAWDVGKSTAPIASVPMTVRRDKPAGSIGKNALPAGRQNSAFSIWQNARSWVGCIAGAATIDRLDAMSLFVAAVDEGSLAAAARRHGRSPATLTRAVAMLEARAGEPLLLRSTRRLSVTAAGEQYLAVWRDVLARLDEAVPGGPASTIRGRMTLTAPELFGALNVMPVLETFLAQHSQVVARALLVNRVVDLVAEGVDLAIRLAPLPDSTMSAIKLGDVRTLLCGSPEYLARRGSPSAPSELAAHECIGLNVAGDGELWAFRTAPEVDARVRSMRVRTRLSVSSADAAIQAALRGRGLVRARSYQVVDELGSGRLVRLLTRFEPPATPVSVIFPAEQGKRRLLRAFLDHAVPLLKHELSQWNLLSA